MTYDYFNQFKDYKYPYQEVGNDQIRQFLTEIDNLITKEREFAQKNNLKSPNMRIQGINDSKVYTFSIYLSKRADFSQKILPYIRKIPEILPDLLHLTIQNDISKNLFPSNYFQKFNQLTRLNLYSLKITKLPSLDGCKNLNYLLIGDMSELRALPPFNKLIALEKIIIENMPRLSTIPPLAPQPPELTKKLKQNIKIIKKKILENFNHINVLAQDNENQIDLQPAIKNLLLKIKILKYKNEYEISKLTNLRELIIENTPELHSIQLLENLYRLQKLQITDAPKLRHLPSMASLIHIRGLYLTNLGITTLPDEFGIGGELFIIKCANLQTISPGMCNFEKIQIGDCVDLKTLPECLINDKFKFIPQICVYGLDTGSPKLQVSEKMRERVEIRTPKEFEEEYRMEYLKENYITPEWLKQRNEKIEKTEKTKKMKIIEEFKKNQGNREEITEDEEKQGWTKIIIEKKIVEKKEEKKENEKIKWTKIRIEDG